MRQSMAAHGHYGNVQIFYNNKMISNINPGKTISQRVAAYLCHSMTRLDPVFQIPDTLTIHKFMQISFPNKCICYSILRPNVKAAICP